MKIITCIPSRSGNYPSQTAAVELRYRAMLEQIPAIIYTDSAGKFNVTMYINPQIEFITGYTPEEWIADRELMV